MAVEIKEAKSRHRLGGGGEGSGKDGAIATQQQGSVAPEEGVRRSGAHLLGRLPQLVDRDYPRLRVAPLIAQAGVENQGRQRRDLSYAGVEQGGGARSSPSPRAAQSRGAAMICHRLMSSV